MLLLILLDFLVLRIICGLHRLHTLEDEAFAFFPPPAFITHVDTSHHPIFCQLLIISRSKFSVYIMVAGYHFSQVSIEVYSITTFYFLPSFCFVFLELLFLWCVCFALFLHQKSCLQDFFFYLPLSLFTFLMKKGVKAPINSLRKRSVTDKNFMTMSNLKYLYLTLKL